MIQKPKRIASYLYLRHGIYYFQMRLPREDGRQNVYKSGLIRKSLKTGDLREATNKARILWVSFRDSPYTSQQIGQTWEVIYGKIDRTIPIDLSALKERSQAVRLLSKKLKAIVCDMCEGRSDDPFHQMTQQALKSLAFPQPVALETERLLKITLTFLFFVICIGLELDNSAVRNYWEKIGVNDPIERLGYIVERHQDR